MKILVLGGGDSPERDVSLRSAAAVATAARELGHEVVQLDPRDDHDQLAGAITASELVLPILHGEGGEDGTIQEVIEHAGIPYLGSNPRASRRCFDKAAYKDLLVAHQLPTATYEEVTKEQFHRSPLVQHPYVLKPVSGGSSLDTFIIRDITQPPAKLLEVFNRYPTMLLEELIEGVEVTVGILDTTALPLVEIIPPPGKEFDYENKYNGATREVCPPEHVSQADQLQVQQLALMAHNLAGCRHLSRTDIIISTDGRLYILETNTLPGMTSQSLYPRAAAADGLAWRSLVERLIDLASHSAV